MAERWTRQRRMEHTRGLLLDAAEEVFAKQGFGGSALDDIAEVAGYTRGAIYSHFGTKEELFLAVIERHINRFLDSFADVIESFEGLDTLDIEKLAQKWRDLTIAGPNSAALGYEFSLFLLRNPDARDRVTAQREEAVNSLANYVTGHIDRLGGELQMPAETLARLLIASHEGVTILGHIDGEDLYGPFLQMVMANVAPKPAAPKRPRSRRAH
ncbi:TetR/AcrR family transcriptional regulator [Mycolicibacterium baixiangningiae]|uniref:TetR/AcrR family transcriptional regulator n=1 Tax=Mycolicibacterium baixiangningiae TaxID=2761578 RepID=UPI001865BA7E|nr:TetR/AcrR family transcriptional regulator [Mycolicibacterium baixiangningiae]